MAENEIKEFVSKSIEQIKAGLPVGCGLDGKFDFDISVVTTKEKGGKIDIKLAGIGAESSVQQLHRIRFSIFDHKSRKESIEQGMAALRRFIQEMALLDQQMKRPKQINGRKKNAKIRN